MRIRKNAKLSPLLFSYSSSSSLQNGWVPVESLQTHVCQLNQSPWDVIPFDSDSIQLDLDDTFTAANNGSAADSFGAVESAASMMDADDKVKIQDTMMVVGDDNHDNSRLLGNNKNNSNNKGVARNACCHRQCKNGAKQGQSFCDHHYNNNNSINRGGYSNKKGAVTTVTGSRNKPRAKKAPASNPNEFYYYSGFGPLWGKRRGDKNGDGSKNSVQGGENSIMVESDNVAEEAIDNDNVHSVVTGPSEMENEEFDYVDDDEEEDIDEDDGGKKRMRKPVKARSLKSLM